MNSIQNQCPDCKGWGFKEFDDHSYGCASCEGTGVEPNCEACHDKGYTLKPGYDGVWREVVCKECENSALQGRRIAVEWSHQDKTSSLSE